MNDLFVPIFVCNEYNCNFLLMLWKSLLRFFLIKQISKLIAIAIEVFKKDFFYMPLKLKKKLEMENIVYRFR